MKARFRLLNMLPDQMKLYRKLRRCGLGRDEALREAGVK